MVFILECLELILILCFDFLFIYSVCSFVFFFKCAGDIFIDLLSSFGVELCLFILQFLGLGGQAGTEISLLFLQSGFKFSLEVNLNLLGGLLVTGFQLRGPEFKVLLESLSVKTRFSLLVGRGKSLCELFIGKGSFAVPDLFSFSFELSGFSLLIKLLVHCYDFLLLRI